MIAPLVEAVDGLAEAWGAVGEVGDLTRAELMAAVQAMGQLRRCSDSLQAQLASAVADESRSELGSEKSCQAAGVPVIDAIARSRHRLVVRRSGAVRTGRRGDGASHHAHR